MFLSAAAAVSEILVLGGCGSGRGATGYPIAHPQAVAYSRPAPVNEVQDAAFWIHPTDPARSLLLLSNERRGLEVHKPDGTLLKLLDDAPEPQYVDVLYGYSSSGGVARDLAVVSCAAQDSPGVKVYFIDPAKSKLADATAGQILKVFDGSPPLGLFTYHSRVTGKCYFFVTNEAGEVEQYELVDGGDGKVAANLVRQFQLHGKSKGGVADDEHGMVYLSEDKTGVWRFGGEPDAPVDGKLVIRAGENGLIPNVRGPALYRGAGDGGYLLVLGQGPKGGATARINVYERMGENRFIAAIQPAAGTFGAPEHASGLDVTSCSLGPSYPLGALAVNDQVTDNGSETFLLFDWRDIAAGGRLPARR